MSTFADQRPISVGTNYAPGGLMLSCRIPFWEMVGHIILWVLLSIITLGIGAFFFVYSVQKMVINHTDVVNRRGDRVGRLRCEFSVTSSIGHVLLWVLLTIVTLGLALPFYIYRVNRVVTSASELILDQV